MKWQKEILTFIYKQISFPVFSDAQHSETHVSCFPVVFSRQRTHVVKEMIFCHEAVSRLFF